MGNGIIANGTKQSPKTVQRFKGIAPNGIFDFGKKRLAMTVVALTF